MTTFTKRFGTGLLCVFAAVLAACSGSGSDTGGNDPTQIDSPTASNVGYLNLSVSDAPIKDAAKVCIRFDGVELKHADSDDKETIDFDEPKVINLLAYQGDQAHLILAGAELPAGNYQWIRLKVKAERGLGAVDGDPTSKACDDGAEGSYLVKNTSDVHNLFIPSGSQRGLQLIKDITIPANRTGDYTAEWDLGKSFNSPPGLLPDVMMKPVVKLVANSEVGTLTGQVADGLITLDSCDDEFVPSVYVFDDGVTPNPFDDPFAEDDAVATGMVEQVTIDDSLPQWRYTIGFLLAGNYEAAYTCNGVDFIPLAGKPAEIVVGDVETVDFDMDDLPPMVGSLTGDVAAELYNSASCTDGFDKAVYVFEEGVTPSADATTVATGLVAPNGTTETYRYLIEDLLAGTYTAAFTCTGTDFVPVDGKPAVITSGEEETVDFTADDAAT